MKQRTCVETGTMSEATGLEISSLGYNKKNETALTGPSADHDKKATLSRYPETDVIPTYLLKI